VDELISSLRAEAIFDVSFLFFSFPFLESSFWWSHTQVSSNTKSRQRVNRSEEAMRTADEQRDEEEEWEDKDNEDVRWDQENACVRLAGKSVLYNFRDVAACTPK
jgi:hypothetical protein